MATDVSITGTSISNPPTTGATFIGGVFDGGSLASATLFIGSGAGDPDATLLKQLASGAVTIGQTTSGVPLGNLTLVASSAIVANSANNLTLTAGNTLTLNSTVSNSGSGALTFTGGTGGIVLGGNSMSITTATGSQTFNGATVLTNNVSVNSTGGAVNFNGTVDGSFNLSINSAGPITFAAPVGATTALARLDTAGTGSLTLNGNVTTSGILNLGNFINLGANAVLSTLNSQLSIGAVSGNGHNLTLVPGSGLLTGSSMNGVATLAFGGTGNASFSGGPINATTADLSTKLASTVTFGGGLNVATLITGTGAYNLSQTGGTITNAVTYGNTGTLTLNGVTFTGGATATAPSAITLSGPISASGVGANLVFGSASTGVSLSGDTTLQSGNGGVSLAAITGNNHNLTVDNNAASSVTGSIAGVTNFSKNGTGILTLSAANNYSGNTNLNAGTLQDGAAGAFSSASRVSVASGATLNVTANETINGLNDSGGAGGSVAIPNNGTALTVTGGGSNFSGVISGHGGLTLSGGALLTLTGTNTYDGPTVINDNNPTHDISIPQTGLQIGNGGTTGSITGAITNNGFVNFNRSNATAFSGGISGIGSVNQNGTGTLTLGGTNTYSGSTNLNAGTLADAALGSFSPNSSIFFFNGLSALNVNFNETIKGLGGLSAGVGSTTNLAPNVTLTISPTGLTYGGSITGAATSALVLAGSGTQALTGTNTYGGGTTIGAGTILQIGASGVNSGLTGSLAGNVLDNGTLIFARADNLTFPGVISGSGSLVQNGTGTLTLTGTNTFGAGTTISFGMLQVGDGGTAGSITGGVFLNNNGTLAFNHSDAVTFAGAINGNGNLVQAGSGTLTLTASNVYSGLTTINTGSTLSIGNGGTSGSLNGASSAAVVDNGTLIFNRSDNTSFNGQISGTGGLVKLGAGTLTLNNTGSTFQGPVAIQSGVLAVTTLDETYVSSSLGAPHDPMTGVIKIGNGATGATLRYIGSSSSYTDRNIDLAGTTGGATLDVSGSGFVTFAGNVTASGVGSKTLTLSGNNINNSNAIQGVIADNSTGNTTAVQKVGTGTWVLSGANTYSGNTTVNVGTLLTGASNSLPSTSNVVVDATSGFATLDLNGKTQHIGSLTFGGTGNATFTGTNNVILGSNGTLTLGGDIVVRSNGTNRPAAAVIAGSSPSIFSGNPFTGTLSLGGVTRTFNVASTNAGGVADLAIYSYIMSGSDAPTGFSKTGAGSLFLGSDNNINGPITVSQGTLFVGDSYATGTGPLSLASGATLAPNVAPVYGKSASDITLSNAILLASGANLGTASQQSDQSLHLAGDVTIGTTTSSTIHFPAQSPVFFNGNVTAPAGSGVTFDGGGIAILTGTTSANITNIAANGAATIFGSATSIPASISADATGYLGVAYTGFATSLQGDFLSHVNKSTTVGTIGFDSPSETAVNTFTGVIDLTGFNSAVRLGSKSGAVISGTITPVAGNNYKFGDGGGVLVVQTNLSGATGVTVNSTTDPLSVVFRGNNSYTGNLDVTNSLALLDSTHALPAGRSFSLGAGGYMGYTENFTDAPNFGAFLSRMTTATGTSVLGIDSSVVLSSLLAGGAGDGIRVVTDPINLGGRGAVYLGTATNAALLGPITAPTGGTLYVTGVERGNLAIGSTLASGNVTAVTVGLPSTSVLASGKATVELLGSNTYTGGTTLNSGTLRIGATTKLNGSTLVSGPLGLGTLTVASGGNMPTLAVTDYFLNSNAVVALNNAISLASNLQVGELQPYYTPPADASAPVPRSSGYFESPQLALNGMISGSGGLFIDDNVALNAANTFAGGVTLNSGSLTLGNSTALGTGALNVTMPTYEYSSSLATTASLTLSNRINLNGYIDINAAGALTLNGQVNLNQSSTIWNDGGPLVLNGAITGNGRLTIGGGQAAINGTSNIYGGGTEASYWSTVVFGSAASIPANPQSNALISRYGGYIGVGSSTFTNSLQNDFINRFDKLNTQGAIGFDSASRSSPNTFGGNIDLSATPTGVAFNSSARLGSSTAAILSGTITPQNSVYNFGDGGGTLQVTSSLVNQPTTDGPITRSVYVSSFNNPLTLLLTPVSANTYTGGTSISNSAVVFSAAGLPAPQVGIRDVFLSDQNAYVGLQLTGAAADSVNDPAAISGFLSRVTTGSSKGFVGFDSVGTQRTISTDLDLSGVGSGVYLGTTSNIIVSGNLTFGGTSYNFAGYKGGLLTVASTLSGTNSVVIGSNTTAAAGTDPSNPGALLSTVALNGSNSYSGGTQLYSGRLVLGNNNALGASSGVLTVNTPYGDSAHPKLEAGTFGLLIPNNVVLNDDLTIGGSTMELSGLISGGGEIYKTDGGTLTLSHANTFSGGIYVQQGILALGNNQAAGTGPLSMGGPLGPVASFTALAPSIGTLSGDNVNDQLWLANGATLTINQGADTEFRGTITGVNGGTTTGGVSILAGASSGTTFALSLSGSGDRLRLSGASNYSGTTTIGSGVTVVAAAPSTVVSGSLTSGPLGTGTVTLNGGKLAVDSGITLYNSLALNSGSLGGRGTFSPAAAPLIGSGMVLAPGGGGSGPGTLAFATGLTLGAGGTYNWQLQFAGLDPTAGPGHGWDLISVSGALNVSATSANPFVVNVVSLGVDGTSGYVSDFNPAINYTWKIATWTTPLTTFDATSFRIDATSAFANATGVGQFFLNLDSNRTALQLNFTPVPEPGTWLLLGLGGLVLAFVSRRRVGTRRS